MIGHLGHFLLEFFLKFGHRTPQDIAEDLLWLFLKFFHFDDSRTIRVFFRKWVPSENQRYLNDGASGPTYLDLAYGGQMMGLQDGLIFLGCNALKQLLQAAISQGSILDTFEAH